MEGDSEEDDADLNESESEEDRPDLSNDSEFQEVTPADVKKNNGNESAYITGC